MECRNRQSCSKPNSNCPTCDDRQPMPPENVEPRPGSTQSFKHFRGSVENGSMFEGHCIVARHRGEEVAIISDDPKKAAEVFEWLMDLEPDMERLQNVAIVRMEEVRPR